MTDSSSAGPSPRMILMIVADQLRADHVGFGGLPHAATPNLDALAASGQVFDRTHVTNPICMPSRATLATGRWPSAHGTRTNGVPLDPRSETVMTALARNGWACSAIGKLHYQAMGWPFTDEQQAEIDATDPEATESAIIDASPVVPRFGQDWEDRRRHFDQSVTLPSDYYGFSSVDLITGHGDRASGHYHHWVRSHGVNPDGLCGWKNSAVGSTQWSEVWQTQLPAELSTSAYVAEQTIAEIERAATRDRPTFVFASFPDPHHPFCPPAEYAAVVDAADVALPRTFHQQPEGLPPHLAHMLNHRGTPNADPTFAFAATEAQFREAFVAEIGLMAQLDAAVGQILSAVNRCGLSAATDVIFTSDHGDLFGDHGLMLKHYVHYEGLTRVPLVIREAEGTAGRSDALVSNADIAPTILDLADVPGFRGIQGRSLTPILRGDATDHRDAVLVEEDQPVGVTELAAPVRMRTVISDAGRLTLYHGTEIGELYDHHADPDESVNRFGQPDAATLERELRDQLLHEVLAVADQGRQIVSAG